MQSAKCKVQRPKCKSPSCFSFYALAVKRTVCGRRRLGRYPILRLTSSLRCARGGAAAGWIEKAQSAERLQACRGARCSFSDRAGWRCERETAWSTPGLRLAPAGPRGTALERQRETVGFTPCHTTPCLCGEIYLPYLKLPPRTPRQMVRAVRF